MVETGKKPAFLALAKGLNKAGFIGGILYFLAMGSAAAADLVQGNEEAAKKKAKEFAVDVSASRLGEVIGGAVAAIALGAMAAVGVTVSAPFAAALLMGGALIGGFIGEEQAKKLYDLMGDRNKNNQIDFIDRLEMLFFGQTYTLDVGVSMDIFGRTMLLDSTLTKAALIENAKRDVAWRYVIRELNPFVIEGADYSKHNKDLSLEYYDELTAPNGMTEEFVKDRVDMLWLKLQFDSESARDDNDLFAGSKPYSDKWNSNSIQGDWDYVDHMRDYDLDTGVLTLQVDGVGVTDVDHQIIFGENKTGKPDDLSGDEESDRIYGRDGDDKLSGLGGDDIIEGNLDKDVLDGGEGSDKLLGGADDDELIGGDGFDLLVGGTGIDKLQGDGDNDALYGGDDNDNLDGGADNDFLKGGDGADTLVGGSGNDYEATQPGEMSNIIKAQYLYGRLRRISDRHKREGECAIPGEICMRALCYRRREATGCVCRSQQRA